MIGAEIKLYSNYPPLNAQSLSRNAASGTGAANIISRASVTQDLYKIQSITAVIDLHVYAERSDSLRDLTWSDE
jgi:hypothetical protein